MELIKREQFLSLLDKDKKLSIVPYGPVKTAGNKTYGSAELSLGYYIDEDGYPFRPINGDFAFSQKESPIIVGKIDFSRWDLVFLSPDVTKEIKNTRLNDLSTLRNMYRLEIEFETSYSGEEEPFKTTFSDGHYEIVDKKTGEKTSFYLMSKLLRYFMMSQLILFENMNLPKKQDEFLIFDKELEFIRLILDEKRKINKNVD